MKRMHTFHVPVMGTGFSIDTPIKVAKYGISSVISLVDDVLIEDMRKFYCERCGEPYTPITKYEPDFRAKRITAYLNLVDKIVKKQFAELKASAFEIGTEISKYFELLPETSPLKMLYNKMLRTSDLTRKQQLQNQLRESIHPGDINVNIMTKLDRPNYAPDGTVLPTEYSDALAALRGYAQSTLESAIVFSAGINQRLYGYVEQFKDFYADASGFIKKKIVLKVSDYRSSFIQGKFFAKKGLWVSEYRIESSINCGGHAFITPGHLFGPIMEEFKQKRQELITTLHEIYNNAVQLKNKISFAQPHAALVTAQGGIGTAQEDRFIRSFYKLDGTGWATPFLLCPEVTNVDQTTLEKLSAATENDVYLSDVSPLGVPFNNLRGNCSDNEKERKVQTGKPGSACPKGFLVSNTEFTDKPICTASRQYQKLKLEELQKLNLPAEANQQRHNDVVKKACICNDLGEGVLIKNAIPKNGGRFTAVCPGPNIAYFSKIVTLLEMVGHIYGKRSILNAAYRPHMFIKELKLYIDYFIKEVQKNAPFFTQKQLEYFNEFQTNLLNGIEYYRELFPQMMVETKEYKRKALEELQLLKTTLESFVEKNLATLSNSAQVVAV